MDIMLVMVSVLNVLMIVDYVPLINHVRVVLEINIYLERVVLMYVLMVIMDLKISVNYVIQFVLNVMDLLFLIV